MELIDSHCHLQFDDYDDDRDKVITSSIAAGVRRMVCVGVSLDDSERAAGLAQKHKEIWATAGAHPHDGADFLNTPGSGERLKELFKKPKVVAAGEIGLDYYHQNSPKADQQKSFRLQLEAGLDAGLPFVFHVREAWGDFWKIIDEYENIRGVVHSFSAHQAELDGILARSLYVGLNGIMTFTRDELQLEAARAVPLDRLLLETDAPFLTPKPFRGTRCEPKHVADTAAFLADLRSESLQQLAAASTNNAEKLFGLKR